MADGSYFQNANFQSGWIVGGHNNSGGTAAKPKPRKEEEVDKGEVKEETEQKERVETKQSNKQQQLRGGGFPHEAPHPPGAISYAYSFTPYQRQYPPPPPYGRYDEYNSPPQYQYQYPPPSPPQYQYRGGYGSAPPQKASGRYGYYGGYQMPRGGHDYYGGGGRGYDGYYEEYHGPGYPGQFPPPNQGGYNYGMSRNDSRSLQDVNQVDAVKKHAHEHNHDGGQKATGGVVVAAAAASSSVVAAS